MQTDRLLMRQLREDDWEYLADYVTDDPVTRYDHPGPTDKDELRRAVATLGTLEGFWAICEKQTGEMFGHLACTQSQPSESLTWDIGIGLNPRFQHRGYATEACGRTLEYCFQEQGARRVVASCHPENAPA